jgi:hypothetical protein
MAYSVEKNPRKICIIALLFQRNTKQVFMKMHGNIIVIRSVKSI